MLEELSEIVDDPFDVDDEASVQAVIERSMFPRVFDMQVQTDTDCPSDARGAWALLHPSDRPGPQDADGIWSRDADPDEQRLAGNVEGPG